MVKVLAEERDAGASDAAKGRLLNLPGWPICRKAAANILQGCGDYCLLRALAKL